MGKRGERVVKRAGVRKGVVWIAVGILVLGAMAGVSYLVGSRLLAGGTRMPTSANGEAVLYHAGKYLTNLRDDGGRRYISVDITLELSHDRLARELDRRQAMLRDLIISVLRSKTYGELEGEGGMNTLSRELTDRVNALVESGRVSRIFFTDFVVQ